MVSFEHPAMDLEQEYYSAIGEFIFRYAQLEYQMHELVWFALDELEWRFNNRSNPYLFRDTLVKLLGSSNLEYKELVAA